MSKTIYKLCLIRGYTEAYYQLTDTQKKAFWEEFGKLLEPTGAEMSSPYYDCQWANDKYLTWFIMKYPDLESAFADTHMGQKIQLYRYLISETILGIEVEDTNLLMGINE